MFKSYLYKVTAELYLTVGGQELAGSTLKWTIIMGYPKSDVEKALNSKSGGWC
jgi:hypothetical protein